MILFNRLNGKAVAVNPDLIERAESTPDTVITFVDGKKLLVAESLEQVLALITDYRAYVIARSTDLQLAPEPRPALHVVPNEIVSAPGASTPEADIEFFSTTDSETEHL
ncbi:MAG: flagellar FlbD family protein [Actinomycetota bacterium]